MLSGSGPRQHVPDRGNGSSVAATLRLPDDEQTIQKIEMLAVSGEIRERYRFGKSLSRESQSHPREA